MRRFQAFVVGLALLGLSAAPGAAQDRGVGEGPPYQDDGTAYTYESPPAETETEVDAETYDEGTIIAIASDFFGGSSEALAKIVQKVFADLGRPNAYIAGQEGSGAIAIGLRYGSGELTHKLEGSRKIYWRGPSIGLDFGGNAAKSFTLVYNLDTIEDIFQRFPGVDGSFYYVAGLSVNYQQRGNIVLAPIRAGVGLRGGINIGYLHYTRKRGWFPF